MHGTSSQADLFAAEPAPSPVYRPDPDRVRGRLRAIVDEARAADGLPWSAHELRLYRTIVPQMVLSLPGSAHELRLYRTIVPQMVLILPDDEAARWRADFDAELERLAA